MSIWVFVACIHTYIVCSPFILIYWCFYWHCCCCSCCCCCCVCECYYYHCRKHWSLFMHITFHFNRFDDCTDTYRHRKKCWSITIKKVTPFVCSTNKNNCIFHFINHFFRYSLLVQSALSLSVFLLLFLWKINARINCKKRNKNPGQYAQEMIKIRILEPRTVKYKLVEKNECLFSHQL